MNTLSKKSFQKKPLKILFEDEYYVVFDKPSGLLVIPTPKNEKNTLVNIANENLTSHLDPKNSFKLHPCHRLDRDTSGAIIFAKGKRNQQGMMKAFQELSVGKKYIAFIHGRLPKNKGEIRESIRDLDKVKYQKNAKAQPAVTRYKVVKTGKDFSIVEVYPLTGRTNQIRIHFSNMGHPLLGERKYAFARDYRIKFRRTALHAKELQFTHPVLNKKIKINAPLPEDMKRFWDQN